MCLFMRAVRDVWSCLLGGVARTDTILSSPHDNSDVNTKQARHGFIYLFKGRIKNSAV